MPTAPLKTRRHASALHECSQHVRQHPVLPRQKKRSTLKPSTARGGHYPHQRPASTPRCYLCKGSVASRLQVGKGLRDRIVLSASLYVSLGPAAQPGFTGRNTSDKYKPEGRDNIDDAAVTNWLLWGNGTAHCLPSFPPCARILSNQILDVQENIVSNLSWLLSRKTLRRCHNSKQATVKTSVASCPQGVTRQTVVNSLFSLAYHFLFVCLSRSFTQGWASCLPTNSPPVYLAQPAGGIQQETLLCVCEMLSHLVTILLMMAVSPTASRNAGGGEHCTLALSEQMSRSTLWEKASLVGSA